MTQKFYSSFSFLWCNKVRCTLTPQECGDILPLQARGFMCRQYCVLPSCSSMPCSCAKTKRMFMFVDMFRIECRYKQDILNCANNSRCGPTNQWHHFFSVWNLLLTWPRSVNLVRYPYPALRYDGQWHNRDYLFDSTVESRFSEKNRQPTFVILTKI